MRDRLIELLKGNLPHFTNDAAFWNDEHIGELADYLLKNGVIVPPKPRTRHFPDNRAFDTEKMADEKQ